VRRTHIAAAAACTLSLTLGPASTALAHGDSHVGELDVVIGFGTEPAYAGMPNSVQVRLEHGGEPVVDAEGLTVEVTFGDRHIDYDLEPNFLAGVYGEPGDYRAYFVPSEPGAYTFHVRGEVEGEEVDVEMTSGPDTFAEVQSTTGAAFPPVDVPSTEELTERLEQDSERTTQAVADAKAAKDEASSARTVALTAVLLGAIGVIAGIAGLAAARRRPTA